MAESIHQQRLFIGIPLPSFFVNTLTEVQSANLHINKIRWTPSQNLHVTLYFLGNTITSEIAGVIHQLEGVARKMAPFELVFHQYQLAPKRRPYMIWATFQPNASFVQLAKAIDAVFNVERNLKDPRAHITLARFKYLQNPSRLVLPSGANTPEIAVSQMILWASVLKPEGPIYTSLHAFDLGEKR